VSVIPSAAASLSKVAKLGLASPCSTPNDFESTAEIARALNDFERHYNEIATPFARDFTRQDLADLIDRLADHDGEPRLSLAA
jgi:hypothetical protein